MINTVKKFSEEYRFVNSKPSLKVINKRFNGNITMITLYTVYKVIFGLQIGSYKRKDTWLDALIFKDMYRK
jgi:hypothetical protein